MGKCITQKILERVTEGKVEPGKWALIHPDLLIFSEVTYLMFMRIFRDIDYGYYPPPWDPKKVMLVIDHSVQNVISPNYLAAHQHMRKLAEKHGVIFYDIGRGGLRHMVGIEKGHVRPGMFVQSTEPNLANMGVFGALNFMSTFEMMETYALGETWFLLPRYLKFNVSGKFQEGVMSRDLAQRIIDDFPGGFSSRLEGSSFEFGGSTVEDMSLDSRQNLLALLFKVGAATAVMSPDQKALEWIEPRAKEPFELVRSDHDAEYDEVFDYEVTRLEPQIVLPNEGTSKAVSEVEGTPVDAASIGSCCSGRLEDLRVAAKVLKGRKVHDGVRMYITPISQETYMAASKEGLLEILAEAGAAVCTPCCGTCWGYIGQLDANEAMLATHTHNFPGRGGHSEALIYLASPYTVAASAVEGKITDPRKYAK